MSEQVPADQKLASAMTMREKMAMEILSGMLCDPERSGSYEVYATDAVAFTDALIKELSR